MDRLLQDLRHAVRVLLKTPAFAVIVIFTLAVGIGANTAMFSIVNGVLLQGLPFPDADRLVDLNEVERADRTRGAIAPATFLDWRRLSTTLDTMAAYRQRTFNVALASGEPERVAGASTSSTFFDVLGVAPILGRQFTRDDAEPGKGQNVVLSYGFWQRRFAGSPDVPVVRGREFERGDAVAEPNTILINEAMARREFPDRDPVGRRFTFGPGEDGTPVYSTIVGVVANVRQYRADMEPVAMAYGPSSGAARSAQNLVVRTTGDPMASAAGLRATLQALDPALPISPPRTLGAVIGASLTQRRFNMTLLAVFAGIALVLAMAGIYGTVSYAVAQRHSEIGIRVALGATSGEILRLVLVDALKPVVGGLVVGLGAAFALARLLERLVFGVSTTDPLTFVSLPALLALVAFVAGFVPALRATRVDPLDALRMD